MQTILLSNTDNMNYIGYINKAQYFEHTTEIINLMKGHGCVNIHIEETKDKKRIEWCKFIDSLSNGDSAVFASFDNVFHNFNDMMFFILKSATPFPKCYLHKEEWTFDS